MCHEKGLYLDACEGTRVPLRAEATGPGRFPGVCSGAFRDWPETTVVSIIDALKSLAKKNFFF